MTHPGICQMGTSPRLLPRELGLGCSQLPVRGHLSLLHWGLLPWAVMPPVFTGGFPV